MTNIHWYSLVILPLIVFCARVLDISRGAMRIILTSRDKRRIAPLLGRHSFLIRFLHGSLDVSPSFIAAKVRKHEGLLT